MEKRNPFKPTHFIGYVNQVTAQFVKVHFPSSTLLQSFTFKGENLNGGLVGNFVVIEGEHFGFLGKILELSLPEQERLELSERSFKTKDFHPTGKIEILLSFDLFEPTKVDKGLNSLPVIGAKVYVCSSDFIKGYFRQFGVKQELLNNSPVIELGTLTYDKSAKIEVSQQALFGRHCAVVGTTGGGKSFTTSKLIEGIKDNRGKALLIDATGEYYTHDKNAYSAKAMILSKDSYFPYTKLSIGDLFVLFRPAGQVQQPILLEAIKSLKIVSCLMAHKEGYSVVEQGEEFTFKIGGKDLVIEKGCVRKQGKETAPFKNAYFIYVDEIENNSISDFDINNLPRQIINECYQVNGDRWSSTRDDRNFSNCTSLLLRINNILNDDDFKKMFGFRIEGETNLIEAINTFLDPANNFNLLRLGFERVPYNFQAREILANAIGKYLLTEARHERFKSSPLVLFLDEAHQFLNKNVKDEYFELTELNAFDSIAKECRKYGLFLTIATQMPRDIPVGTLSQIGTFIVHRLINHFDKESIANASSSGNKTTLDFLPVLGAGEAILMGVDFPMPVMLKITKPLVEPDSGTPQFVI
ncbi:MAG: ATP-binding protein [Bacteroidales bacterium]|jgi:hypothetical protein